MKKYILFLILFQICSLHSAQIINKTANINSTADYENIIRESGKFGKDTLQLKKYLAPLMNTSNSVHHALYYTLLAEAYSESFDRINKRSNAFFQHAIRSVHKSEDQGVITWVNLTYSRYFYKYRLYKNVIPYFMDASFSLETLPRKKILFPGRSFQFVGWVLQSLSDEEDSNRYLLISNKYFDRRSSDFASNLDNIGNNFLKRGDHKNSEKYYKAAIKLSEEINDLDRLAKATGNLGILYFKKGYYDKAEDLLKKDLALSEIHSDRQNTMFATISLAKVYKANGKSEEAEKMIAKAENIARSKSYYLSSEQEILRLKLQTFAENNNTKEQLDIMKRLNIIEDSVNKSDGELAITKANYEIHKMRLTRKLEENKLQISNDSTNRNLFIAAIILLIIMSTYLFYSFRKKLDHSKNEYRKTVNFFENEKQIYEDNLNNSEKNLQAQIEFLKSKNSQIQQLSEKILYLKRSLSSKIENKHGKLNELLKSHLMTDENWRNFKVEFKNEYPEIFIKILQDFPEINDSNLRIILLQKLEFTNAEISGLLGVTVDAVKKSKQRLRKKLGDKYAELESLQK